MKKVNLIVTIAIAAASLQACKGPAAGSSSDSSSTTKKDSTSMTKTDTSKTSSDTTDATFAKKAAIGGMAEVSLGKLALTKTASAKIKDFANMMITDHGKANNELMGIAKTENIMLPPGVDTKHQAKMDSLSNLSGAAFDKAYVAAMIEGHEKTLALMKTEASDGKDTTLKAFAAKTAPIVQMHLDAINKINASMK